MHELQARLTVAAFKDLPSNLQKSVYHARAVATALT
jgi:hypothetical protein